MIVRWQWVAVATVLALGCGEVNLNPFVETADAGTDSGENDGGDAPDVDDDGGVDDDDGGADDDAGMDDDGDGGSGGSGGDGGSGGSE